uniref:Hexosyltransferase n=1 Tax=Amblyomma americanum TaxID=6943 RepID=A0A0C9SEC2_AMBAM
MIIFRVLMKCLLILTLFAFIFTALYLLYYNANLGKELPRGTAAVSKKATPTIRYVIAPKHICSWTSNTTSLFVGVVTSAGHLDHRSAIRETWGAALRRMDFKLLFLLGESGDEVLQRRLLEEHKIHGDILQGQFADSYENLTYKTVMLVRWASTFCGEAEFVMKIDDDVLLSVWDLAIALKRLRGVNRTMWGRLYHGFKPIRERTSKCFLDLPNMQQA